MTDNNLKEYIDNNIFTASARDVLEMCGRDLSDYYPILIRISCQRQGMTPLRECGLEVLAKEALDNGCEFVTDLVTSTVVDCLYEVMHFIGTGLIER